MNPNEKKNSIQLDTEDVMDDEVVITVTNIEPVGRKDYRKFRISRVADETQKLEDASYKEKQVPKFQGIKQKGEICKAQVHTTKASC